MRTNLLNADHTTTRMIVPALFGALLAGAVVGILSSPRASDLFKFVVVGAAVVAVLRSPRFGVYLIMVLVPLQYLTGLDTGATAIRYLGWITFAAWASQKLIRKEAFRPLLIGPLFQGIAAFLLLCLVSVLWSPFATWRTYIFTYIQLAGMVIVLVDLVDSRKRLEALLFFLYLGTMIGAGIAISEYLNLFPGWEFKGRALGGFGDGNYSSAAYMFILPYVFFSINNRPGWRRAIGLVSVPVLWTAVAVTASRTGLLSVPIWLLLQFRRLPKRRHRILWILVVISITLLIAQFWPWAIIEYRFSTAWAGGTPQDLGGRVKHWNYTLDKFVERPIMGHGLSSALGTWERFVPHNLFLQVAVRLGLLGLLAMLWILMVTWRSISVAYKRARAHGQMETVSLLCAVQDSMLIYLFFSLTLDTATSRMLWLTFALGRIVLGLFGGVSSRSLSARAKREIASASAHRNPRPYRR